ncbi:ABC transporter ATP-binding protein [Marinimicrococcus flavescens]|uniref:ABC transporter ATP-binding protein n=1 Tax=Marinimicrococcus flavescens TaxID=3031815 RepID=A0AAP3V0K1_9PROT|nr:ABC transporter ATP-binding protein [Marinimicrococcus flavescens]
MTTPVLAVEGLDVEFPSYGEAPVRALHGLDLSIGEQEIVGLVGESGSGKTTLARAIMQLVPPPGRISQGSVSFEGRDLSKLDEEQLRTLRGRAMSMVIANPRSELNPLLTVGQQIGNILKYHTGCKGRELRERVIEMLKEVRIPDPERRYDAFPHELSGGMAQRVVMAIALICNPRLVISDDATSGLDVTVQAQVLELLKRLAERHRTAMLFITRDIGITAHFCDRVAIIYGGEIMEIATRARFFANPMHPYSVLLLAAFSHNPKLRSYWLKEGEAAAEARPAETGCPFAPRCVRVREHCRSVHPELRELEAGHHVRCHFPVERRA